jgi:hypothetical protein
MPDAEHFLGRLVRLAKDEVKLALELYYDSEWVRALLEPLALPEGADRVAISLDDAREGPFIVMTRDGHFVTCLGRGMSPGTLPVVPRDRLEVAARRVARERLVADQRERARAGDERLKRLLRRLFEQPDAISREDFLEVAAWEPLLGPTFLNTYAAMGAELVSAGRLLRQVRRPKRRHERALRIYWNLLHATSHMALLGSMTSDRAHYVALTENMEEARAVMSFPLTGTGVTTFMVKGAWAAGRLGKLLLPAYKRALAEDVAFFELVDTLLALLALGRRSRKLRAEVKKAVHGAPRKAANPHARRLRDEMGREIELTCRLIEDLLDLPQEELEQTQQRVGESYWDEAPPPDRPEIRDLAFTLPLLSWTDGITDGRKLLSTLHLVASSARLPPERFYLPRELLEPLRQPWTPEATLLMLEPMMKAEPPREPTRRGAAKVGRNAPCPCGSGKKYKRCCGKDAP